MSHGVTTGVKKPSPPQKTSSKQPRGYCPAEPVGHSTKVARVPVPAPRRWRKTARWDSAREVERIPEVDPPERMGEEVDAAPR